MTKPRHKGKQRSTDGRPVICSASCCPKHPNHGSGSRMAVPGGCSVKRPGKLGVCTESVARGEP